MIFEILMCGMESGQLMEVETHTRYGNSQNGAVFHCMQLNI